jgi:hypothetical protein
MLVQVSITNGEPLKMQSNYKNQFRDKPLRAVHVDATAHVGL